MNLSKFINFKRTGTTLVLCKHLYKAHSLLLNRLYKENPLTSRKGNSAKMHHTFHNLPDEINFSFKLRLNLDKQKL